MAVNTICSKRAENLIGNINIQLTGAERQKDLWPALRQSLDLVAAAAAATRGTERNAKEGSVGSNI